MTDSFSHIPDFMTIAEGMNVHWAVNREICLLSQLFPHYIRPVQYLHFRGNHPVPSVDLLIRSRSYLWPRDILTHPLEAETPLNLYMVIHPLMVENHGLWLGGTDAHPPVNTPSACCRSWLEGPTRTTLYKGLIPYSWIAHGATRDTVVVNSLYLCFFTTSDLTKIFYTTFGHSPIQSHTNTLMVASYIAHGLTDRRDTVVHWNNRALWPILLSYWTNLSKKVLHVNRLKWTSPAQITQSLLPPGEWEGQTSWGDP